MPSAQGPDLTIAVTYAAAKAGPFVASLSGAIVSLSFMRILTVRGRLMAVVTGTLISAYVAPAMLDWWMPQTTPAVARMIHFLCGVVGLGAMPIFLAWVKKKAGDPLSLVKDVAGAKES
jgi:hypothetical protein